MGSSSSKKTEVNAFQLDLNSDRDSDADVYSTRSDDVTHATNSDDVIETDRSVVELKVKLQKLRALERLNKNSHKLEHTWSEEVRRRLQASKRKQTECGY